jgi:hypothetical protein
MENTKLIHEIHEAWARENGYREEAPSAKQQAASAKHQAPSVKPQAQKFFESESNQ